MSQSMMDTECKATVALRDVHNPAKVPVHSVLVGVNERGVGIEVRDVHGRVADVLLDIEHGEVILYSWKLKQLDEDPTFKVVLHPSKKWRQYAE